MKMNPAQRAFACNGITLRCHIGQSFGFNYLFRGVEAYEGQPSWLLTKIWHRLGIYVRTIGMLLCSVSIYSIPSKGETIFLPPSPYFSLADSPLVDMNDGTFIFEDFEDGSLDLPVGVVGYPGLIMEPSPFTDSVDGDDGIVDGSGSEGKSYRPALISVGFTNPPTYTTIYQLNFTSTEPSGLPTAVGLVITDGLPDSRITVTARDRNGVNTFVHYSDINFDMNSSGSTFEDRFVGVTNALGMREVAFAHHWMGFPHEARVEIDHLQFVIPEPEFGSISLALILVIHNCLVLRTKNPAKRCV
jgi:hypothetical protein